MWMGQKAAKPCTCPRSAQTQLLLAQLEDAGLADGMREITEDYTPKSAQDVPSQLVRADLPDDVVIGVEPSSVESAEKPTGIVLSDGQNTVVLNAQKPAQRASDGTNVTLIEAPLQAKRIETVEQYKEFKRVARGNYPTADFSKEEVLVLESTSNLPDKVFEIVSVSPTNDSLLVQYRVNVFGLDKKTNTHSAQMIKKTKLPIVLEQVL